MVKVKLKDMEIGQKGYTAHWAFTDNYECYDVKCGTMDTKIERTEKGYLLSGRPLNI